VKVTIRRHLYINIPDSAGIYCTETERDLAAVPRKDDWIELAGGWTSVQVKDVTFMADGQVLVEITRMKTNDPVAVAEEWKLVEGHGWQWVGPGPERTGS
jgi:hypothetical protein